VSITASPPATSVGDSDAASASAHAPVPTSAGETCPLCGASLHDQQDWCLRCGAAARTRLAASPNWQPPIAAIAVVLALSLGVLAAALIKLAGDSSSSATRATTTVTTHAAITSAPAATTPGAVIPGAVIPGANGAPATSVPATSAAPVGGASTTRSTGSPTGTLSGKRRIHFSPAVERLLHKFELERKQRAKSTP
jgi:hypothetical protein